MEWFALLALAVLAVPILLVVALVSVSGLKQRVGALERELARLRAAASSSALAPATAVAEPQPMAAVTIAPSAASAASAATDASMTQPIPPIAAGSGQRAVAPAAAEERYGAAATSAAAEPAMAQATTPQPTAPAAPAVPYQPNILDRGIGYIKDWFTVGNVPVKIGMLVLLAGVAALLKYASDQGWLQLPIELRLAGVAAAALAGLVFGWRQRVPRREFALALQGGAIGLLLLTVFAAAKLYGLMPLGAAFALSVVLVAGLGLLAVLQDARSLAVLGILAGFLAPVWLSDGSGNHVALFSYYALLNAAIFAIAWAKAWRSLNLLGFVFTWGIGTAWGVLQYTPSKFWSTEPFPLLFFAFYLLLPILYARRRAAVEGDRVDSWLLFGTPLAAFALQAGLLLASDADAGRLQLAFCALGLALIYTVLAWSLRTRARYAVLAQGHALLAVGFATLAVPLAFSARVTASILALEGAAMLWLGLRQERPLPQWVGLGLQLAAAFAFALGIVPDLGSLFGWDVGAEVVRPLLGVRPAWPVGNATFMG
ncbi:MAG: DUF2339 domain-containing protein, partial [Variovorax sp.]